jgi:nucleotide-binding universal stress UspA family protein
MRALIWITENSWEACVDHARALLPGDAEITLLHVSASDVEQLAAEGVRGLFGRRPPPPPSPPLEQLAAEDARALLAQVRDRLGRPGAELDVRRGRVEREVVAACDGVDLLVLARDGAARLGPPSLGPPARFVVDHAPCQVLLVWAFEPPGLDTIPPPPRHGEHPPAPRHGEHPPPPHRGEHPPPPER